MDTLVFGLPMYVHLLLVVAFVVVIAWRAVRPGYMRVQLWRPRVMRVTAVWKKIPDVGATKRGEPIALQVRGHMYDFYPERIYQQTKWFGIISIPKIGRAHV